MSNKNNVIQFANKTRELPDEAYVPKSIGGQLVRFFSETKCTREEGLNILKGISQLLTTGKHEDPLIHNYVTSFTDHGVTPAELINGIEWVLDIMKELDSEMLERFKGEGDAEKPQIH